MAPPLRHTRDHGAIAVFPSSAALAPLLRRCADLGLGPADMRLLAEHAPASSSEGTALWQQIDPADGLADALADRLWSGGRFGLTAAAVGAAGGLILASLLLAIPGIGAPVQQNGPWALLFVALGGAVSMMPVWLPFGAILEERKVEGYRDRFRRHLRDGACFLLVQADEDTIMRLLPAGEGAAIAHCRFRGPAPWLKRTPH